ncbi:MAG TPA: PLP-dependent aminotransferase family protein [Mycobacteriales bacterium]|nr:PLP-dependent aminotransferase family protein [Mycobacteriales bacterium]
MGTDLISFARGAPSLDIVNIEGLKTAAQHAFERDPGGTTAYGTSVGYQPLRAWVAEKHVVTPDQVLVTNGSMQADAFLFDALVEPGTPVIVEKPTYDRTLLGLRNRGADLHPITVDADGVDTDELRTVLASGVRPTLAHIIPNFHNPAGVTLSLPRRQALVELSREYDFTIFEDDPYRDVRFTGTPLPTMFEADESEHVVYASSFSKTVCPGIRVGYLVGPAGVIAGIAKQATNTYISPNMVSQAIAYQFCVSGGLDESIKTVQVALAERSQRLGEALRREIPDARFTLPEGGYFLWLDLPEDVDVAKLLPAAAERGVAVVAGTDFLLTGGDHSVRLAYSAVTPDRIDEGVARLAAAVAAIRG